MNLRPTVLAALAVLALVAPAGAHAGPTSPTRTVVSLGDSFISGEGGRWQGNSLSNLFSREETDRAYRSFLSYDPNRVYLEGTYESGCNRSDVAEVRSATEGGPLVPVNLACSGAETVNVLRGRAGGHGYKGEPPQDDRLAGVARDTDVEEVVLSIGGNDLGFADVIKDCVFRYLASTRFNRILCRGAEEEDVASRMPAAMSNVRHVIDDVRATMAEAGYGPSDYSFVLQGYPAPVSDAAGNRFPQNGTDRIDYGCPFWDADLDWANGPLLDTIGDNLRAVADAEGISFLDLRRLFDGHEVCARGTRSGGEDPPALTEWARSLNVGVLQGQLQESFHPNALGQQALGTCLRQTFGRRATTEWACTAGPGVAPREARLATLRTAPPPTAEPQLEYLVAVPPDLAETESLYPRGKAIERSWREREGGRGT